VVQGLRRGATRAELDEELTNLVNRCRETGKVGELTLKIKVRPEDDQVVQLEDHVATKLPEFPRSKSMYFVTGDGVLTRQDPRQEEIPLKRVGGDQQTDAKEAQ
jgi:hypothetical protein